MLPVLNYVLVFFDNATGNYIEFISFNYIYYLVLYYLIPLTYNTL